MEDQISVFLSFTCKVFPFNVHSKIALSLVSIIASTLSPSFAEISLSALGNSGAFFSWIVTRFALLSALPALFKALKEMTPEYRAESTVNLKSESCWEIFTPAK